MISSWSFFPFTKHIPSFNSSLAILPKINGGWNLCTSKWTPSIINPLVIVESQSSYAFNKI